MTIHPLVSPPLSQPPEPLMAIRSSSGFSHLRPGIFHISLRTHNIHNREGGGKENKQTWTWVSSKRKKGEVCNTFVLLSVHLWASTSMYSNEIPAKPPGTLTLSRWPTWPLGPQVLAVTCTLLLTSLFYWLPSSVLLSAFFCSVLWPCLPYLSSGLVGNLARKPFVCVSRQNRQRGLLSGTYSHTHRNECHPSCHKWSNSSISNNSI